MTVFVIASHTERKHPMTRMIRQTQRNPPNDHYTVISRDREGQTSRVVIASSPADAAEAHREHYPGCAIIRVVGN
jgi:hypothetical protein